MQCSCGRRCHWAAVSWSCCLSGQGRSFLGPDLAAFFNVMSCRLDSGLRHGMSVRCTEYCTPTSHGPRDSLEPNLCHRRTLLVPFPPTCIVPVGRFSIHPDHRSRIAWIGRWHDPTWTRDLVLRNLEQRGQKRIINWHHTLPRGLSENIEQQPFVRARQNKSKPKHGWLHHVPALRNVVTIFTRARRSPRLMDLDLLHQPQDHPISPSQGPPRCHLSHLHAIERDHRLSPRLTHAAASMNPFHGVQGSRQAEVVEICQWRDKSNGAWAFE